MTPSDSQLFLTDDSSVSDYPFALPPLAGSTLTAALDRLALTDPEVNPLMPRLGFGSNGWVVSGGRSDSGAPLFAFDSHDDLGLPNLFYEVHLFFGEGRQLRGWSVAGLPGVINGFNEHIAWGFTNIGDTQDLFLETRSPEDPSLFRDGDQWYRARTEQVSIPLKGGGEERFSITHTHNGPLVNEEPPISLAWTVNHLQHASLDSLLAFNLAGDWSEFTAALDQFPAPTLNATYADTHGTIGFRTGGVIPRRGSGRGLLPLDGSIAANRWQGMVDAAQMPQRSNPPAGFLAAANARVNAEGDGPLVSADNAAPYRIDRIQQVLSAGNSLDSGDMQALQVDWMDGQAAMLLPTLLALLQDEFLTPQSLIARELLQNWGERPVASRESAAALVFQQWYLALARRVFAAELGELYPRLLRRAYLLNHALDHLLLQGTDSPWWRGARSRLVSESLNDAVASLTTELGAEPEAWRLDKRLHVQLKHELGKAVPALGFLFNRRDEPWGGGASTVGRARYSYVKPLVVNSGATVRVVAEMTAVPRVSAVIPGGQSGHPLSRHYADQYPGWLGGELFPLANTPEQVDGPRQQLSP